MTLSEYRERLEEILKHLPDDEREIAVESALVCFAAELEKTGHPELAIKLRKAMDE